MARYRAADVYAHLQLEGCWLDDRTPHGSVWVSKGAQVFHLPDPFFVDEEAWYVAEIIDEIVVNRWIARLPLPIARFPD